MSIIFARWPAAVRTCAAVALAALAVALGLAALPGTARAATSAPGTTLTCFAVDVSGSNLYSSDGEPPSDPGLVFVRQQVVQLYAQVLVALDDTVGQQVGVVTFGTGIGTTIGPVPLDDAAARARLTAALSGALRPSIAEAAWTSWVAGIQGCGQMFDRSGDRHGMVIMLTDGFPQGPAGGPGRQLSAISPSARRLWADGIAIDPVLYGAAADQPGSARTAMSQLATLGHSQLTLAATPLDMLQAALHLAATATGIPLGGSEESVSGATLVPLAVPPHTAAAGLVLLRSSDQVQLSVTSPSGRSLASLRAGTPGLSLVAPLTHPAAGTYQAGAQGQGSVYAAELLRLDTVQAALGHGHGHGQGPARWAAASPRRSSGTGVAWWLLFVLAVVAAAAAAVVGRLVKARRRPRGVLSVWQGPRYYLAEPDDLAGTADVGELLPGGDRTGWRVDWSHRVPVLIGPGGDAVPLAAGETRLMPVTPTASVTWLPDGADTSLTDEPPGRPPGASPTHPSPPRTGAEP